MTDHLNRMKDELVSYFLCEYSPKSPKRKLAVIVREVALKRYSAEVVEDFIDKRLDIIRADLVDEFNARKTADLPLRFDVADPLGEGHILQGSRQALNDYRIAFQDTLNQLAPEDFEALAALILKYLQCDSVFRTPQSHDQGIDAFGYKGIAPALSRAVTHKLVWIAQAKHYTKHAVSTNVVRELVGTSELMICKIYSTVQQRYKDLLLAPYAPTCLLLLTTHAIPSTVRRLSERAGIFVLEASDIYDLISGDFKQTGVTNFARFIAEKTKDIPVLH